jgi:hypothetical protein
MADQVTDLVWEHNIFVLNAEVVVETVEKQSHACEQGQDPLISEFIVAGRATNLPGR